MVFCIYVKAYFSLCSPRLSGFWLIIAHFLPFFFVQGMAIIFITIMEGPLTTGPERNMLSAVWFCFGLIVVATLFAYSFRGRYLRLENARSMWAQEALDGMECAFYSLVKSAIIYLYIIYTWR